MPGLTAVENAIKETGKGTELVAGPASLIEMAFGTAKRCEEKTDGLAGCPAKVFDAAAQSRASVLRMWFNWPATSSQWT